LNFSFPFRSGSTNIQLKRNGRLVSRLDIYNVLLHGNIQNDVRLAHGDVIFVPPIGATIGIGGEVLRPAIYELKNESRLGEVIEMAGGLLPSASLSASHIDRVKKGLYHTLIDIPSELEKARQSLIKGGDLIRIFPVKQLIDDVVLLSGHVIRPGGYQLIPGMRVSHLLSSSQSMRTNADTRFALLRRELREQRRISVRYLDLKLILNSPKSANNLLLKPRDEVIIFDLAQNRSQRLTNLVSSLKTQSNQEYPPMIFNIDGHIRYKGSFPLQYAARFLDVLKLAGGVLSGTDTNYALIARKSYPDNQLEMLSVAINKARQQPLSEHNPIIHPEDKLFIFNSQSARTTMIKKEIQRLSRETPYGKAAPVVSISGSINHQGDYPLEPGMRVDKLLVAAGGLKEESYGIGAELTRYKLINGEYQIADHQYIDLQGVLQGKKQANLILQAHDHLSIHRKPQWQSKRSISLAGEIKYPGTYSIENNETLCNVLTRAGGLTHKAYPFGAVFLRETIRQKQQQSLDKIQDNLDDLLVQLHLSPSARNNEKMPAGEQKHQIEKVIKKLKRTKALGRMVINLDKIQNCDEEANILLENGDKLIIPQLAYEVSVMGEVYHPSTHIYDKNKGSSEYIQSW